MLLAPATLRAQPAARYDPSLRFRTISTARFDIYYHQREEALARRLAAIAEEVATRMDGRLGRARGRVHVILVDQTDESNGWATVIPYNLIEIAAAPPRPQSIIGNTDDWLRLVFTHEYAHVVHLEKSRGWIGGLRHVFGRLPLFYPNLFLPDWQVEGLATFEESALTGHGRVPAGDFRMILDHAAAADRFAPLDRAGGAVIDWPSGTSAYLYGAYFHEYLADRSGRESLARLADETAGRLLFAGSPAFRRVYGRSLGALWNDFKAATERRLRDLPPEGGSHDRREQRTRLTHHGFNVRAPAFTRDGRLFYSISNPHGFPAVMELPGGAAPPRRLTTRYGGNHLSSAGDLLVFDQSEVVRHTALQSDLYAVTVSSGDTRRLTHEARAGDPDVAPDGRTIVCTVQESTRRILAVVNLPAAGQVAQPVPFVSEAWTEFSGPRWSPDGRSIVAERRRLGGPSEIVIVDFTTRAVKTIVSTARGRNITPMWLEDGATILFSSDRDGRPFTMYAADSATGSTRRLVGAGAGAQSPVLSPDRRRLLFVGYSADGYDLYSIPFDAPEWVDAPDGSGPSSPESGPNQSAVVAPGAVPEEEMDSRAYTPWRTLVPRYWFPIVESEGDEIAVGGATAGWDALGRHGFAVSAAWSSRSQPDWRADYVYSRWRPAAFVDASDTTDGWRDGDVRVRELNAGVLFPVRRVRWSATSLVGIHASTEAFGCSACEAPVDRVRRHNALRFGWSFTSAKSFGYSVSAEEGARVEVTSEVTRRALGADGEAAAFTIDLRKYTRTFPRHGVLAARVAGASSHGDERVRRAFSASGPGPQFRRSGFDVDAIGLMRGFDEGSVIGQHAVVANLDYRFPVAWVQRGVGTIPLFVRTVHAAIFLDAGEAWNERFRASDLRRSIGAEVSLDTVLADSFPLTLAAGVAWRGDRATERGRVVAFGRIGRAF